MTKKDLESLFDRVRTWPESLQEKVADVLLEIEALDSSPYVLSDEERRGVERGLKDMRLGRFASDVEIEALFTQYKR